MNQYPLPNCQQVQRTILKSRKSRQKLELATLELEEVIAQLEMVSRQKRNQHLTNQTPSS